MQEMWRSRGDHVEIVGSGYEPERTAVAGRYMNGQLKPYATRRSFGTVFYVY
jgi:hypothetical protein